MSEVHIDFKDLPDWAKEILRERKIRPRSIPVQIRLHPNVGGFKLTTLHLYNGEEVTELKGATEAAPWESAVANAIALGEQVTLPSPDCMIFEIYSFMGKWFCRLHAHPESVMKALTAPNDLTPIESAVLLATRMYKPSYAGIRDYRYHEVGKRNNVPPGDWIQAKGALIGSGHLTKRGAITTKGLNAIHGLDKHHVTALLKGEDK